MKETINFTVFLKTAFDNGLLANDDIIGLIFPLLDQVATAHHKGLVAPFDHQDLLRVMDGSLYFEQDRWKFPKVIDNIQNAGKNDYWRYAGFEVSEGKHDHLADIYCLGLILGSLAMGLDLTKENDWNTFKLYRANPSAIHSRLHPVICSLITKMTEIERKFRLQSVDEAIQLLKNYRSGLGEKVGTGILPGISSLVKYDDKTEILEELKSRLFDTSRRNRLLYYKPNSRFLNLTLASIPMLQNIRNIKEEQVISWKNIQEQIEDQNEINLNKYLRFDDHIYLQSNLDKIRLEVNHDLREYGFSQLKLVISFLSWYNLKDEEKDMIVSPLLLVPASLKKTRGITNDIYTLTSEADEAEVNPVLAHFLNDLYGVDLPETIDLNTSSINIFFDDLKAKIDAAGQGIDLQLKSELDPVEMHEAARKIVMTYQKKLGISGHLLKDDPGIENRNEETVDPLYHQSPYKWMMEVGNLVLGNFNYKKMSLVQDYSLMIEKKIQAPVFESLFSDQPKQLKELNIDSNDPEQWFHVLTTDSTQTKSILQARTRESYIIQGPPGTGKSQTITNLIADYTARGKKVLFVCEKRAALDVVFHRLKQYGLDELCCYIHDSQADKKSFIKDLSETYNTYINKKLDLIKLKEERSYIIQKLVNHIAYLKNYHQTNSYSPEAAGMEVRKLIERTILLKTDIIELTPSEEEILPFYNEWVISEPLLKVLNDKLLEAGSEPVFCTHPLARIREDIFSDADPISRIQVLVREAQEKFRIIEEQLTKNEINSGNIEKFIDLRNLIESAVLLFPFAESDIMNVADTASQESNAFQLSVTAIKQLQEEHKKQVEVNRHWIKKPVKNEVDEAIEITDKYETSFWRFFSSKWKRLKKELNASYRFSDHTIRPGYLHVLKQLQAEYELEDRLNDHALALEKQYRLKSVDAAYWALQRIKSRNNDQYIKFLLTSLHARDVVISLYGSNQSLRELDIILKQLFYDHDHESINQIQSDLDTITANFDQLQIILPGLKSFSMLSARMKKALRLLPLSFQQLEAVIAFKTIKNIYSNNKEFADADASSISQSVLQIQRLMEDLMKTNALLIRAKVRDQFLRHASLSSLSDNTDKEKNFSKSYAAGRKILENEFSKSKRYKSIRELSNKESGTVLRDLKPIWLMSPLSVSDSLPVDDSFFDVVIFDEASQITVEEGVPALFRAPQAIVVGDDKQMPPTKFFTTKTEDPDDLLAGNNEDDPEKNNDADSLLDQGARSFNQVMLGWHYRSRYETLISYSNHAFYWGQLLTIPDKLIHEGNKLGIVINDATDAAVNVEHMSDRTISFHYLPQSVYEKRSNKDEAAYIAQMVCELLKRKVKETIGIVAFSQEQQRAIESALDNLASGDKEFSTLLDGEMNRHENDQFAGLFVKNLENVQGDERDIIIMSVCYGFDQNRRMIMNFGPVNRKGGEKRLNVIFSRSKQHMAVVSSIRHQDITNDHNEGANYLKQFLHYAEEVSLGNMAAARSILDKLILRKGHYNVNRQNHVVAQQLRQKLTEKGYDVQDQVGQSDFKCSLAVKIKAEDKDYALAILIDDDRHFSETDIVELYSQKPYILKQMGWRVISVFTKDWLHDAEKVMTSVLKALHGQKDHTADFYNSQLAASLSIENKNEYDSLKFHRLWIRDNDIEKFWEIATDQQRLVIRSGRAGSRGQTIVKRYPSRDAAETEKLKMLKEKLANGFSEL